MITLDLSALLTGAVEDFAPAAADRGQLLLAEVPAGLQLTGDREQLTQMLVNLLDNAIRHAGAGARITVSAHASNAALEIVVADTGPGIPAAERDNVLRPFYRLESSRTTEGSGLGLSLVAVIAKRHDATLALADNGPGLRVTIKFAKSGSAARPSDAPVTLSDALVQR